MNTNVPLAAIGRRSPVWLWLGLLFIAVMWPIAWLQIRPVSDNYFFPLWLGYILAVDGLVFYRTGTSLLARTRWRFALLFVASVPLWWLFEAFNDVLQNWHYRLPAEYGAVSYALRASLAFSTVVPAIFVTTELVRSFRRNPLSWLPAMRLERRTLILLHLAGWVMVALVLALPDIAFPLVWISVFFIVDPLAAFAGGRSIGTYLQRGDWSPVFNIALGTVICGFFWEMWNVYALPKWTYEIPYAEFAHVFEMPLLGYGGYIPFGLEIYSMVALFSALLPALQLPSPDLSSLRQIDLPDRGNL